MYRTIVRIFKNTGDESIVVKAYEKGWITEDQKNEILGLTD